MPGLPALTLLDPNGKEYESAGLPAGTYYFQFENIGSGTATGVFHATWEEKLPDSTVIN